MDQLEIRIFAGKMPPISRCSRQLKKVCEHQKSLRANNHNLNLSIILQDDKEI
jgi:hypothetical protein